MRLGSLTVLGMLALAGCEGSAPREPAPGATTPPGSIESVGTTLALVPTRLDASRVAVDLVYAPHEGQVAPRIMELRLRVTGDLGYVESAPLGALASAGKELVVQPQGSELRVIAFAADNTRTLGAGALARFVFTIGAGAGSVSIDPSKPAFAPAEANVGVTLGSAVTVGGAP